MALNDYARANDPFANVGRVQVAVDVSSVIRASPDSFRVAWTERRYQDGGLAAADEGFNYQRAVDDWMRSGHTSSRRSVLRRVEVLGGRTVLLAAP